MNRNKMLLANNVNIIEDTGFGKTESECSFTGTFTVVSN